VAKAEQYAKLITIEANTMVYMARHLYLPALSRYSGDVATGVATKAELGITSNAERRIVERLTQGIDAVYDLTDALEQAAAATSAFEKPITACVHCRDKVLPAMEALRAEVDSLEQICSEDCWPVPTYNQMLFYV
jgi:glutamine synthetase